MVKNKLNMPEDAEIEPATETPTDEKNQPDQPLEAVSGIERHGGKLWLLAEDVRLNGPLTTRESAGLKNWWGGHSDGWGKGISG